MTACPACATPTRDGARFCPRCGLWLSPDCPRCGSDLPPLAIYCDRCGTQVSALPGVSTLPAAVAPPAPRAASPEPQPQRLPPVPRPIPAPAPAPAPAPQANIPAELAAKLEAARATGQMVGERRIVTMLFCDVKGSTEAAERLDPEDWTEIMNGAFERMIRPIYTYEGTLARLMGDALLAFFGAPIAHEDDPQRAVLAALDIQRDMAAYREAMQTQWGLEINVRVGINTGLVVVGAVGSDLRVEYSALGDAINLAARMEQTAAPGTVQIAHDTYRHVKPLFEIEPLGGIEVKGKSEPVLAYRVLGRKVSAGRVRGIEGLTAALVGRETELQTLRAVLGDLRQGLGRIVCVVGEAGLGKSRLVAEARQAVVQPDSLALEWHEVGSLSYEGSQPYGLIQRLMRRVLGVDYSTPPDRLREHLRALVGALPPERQASALPAFETLCGLEHAPGQVALVGAAFQRELYEALGAWWSARWGRQPAVLVFDDMHWADAASVELLRRLLPLTEQVPLVLVCVLRGERQAPAWQLKTAADEELPHRYTEIALRPLTPAESSELVDRLLAIAELPDHLRASLLEKTGGNPFFVEEVVRTLIDSGIVVAEDRGLNGQRRRYWRAASPDAEVAIPDNLQALMAARMDRLEEDTRSTLQLASVIGRSFYYRVLARLADQGAAPNELDRHLGTLVRSEMIQEAARVPEVEYRFRNPLMQEATYRTILLKRRREFHRRVGEAMELLFTERLSEMASRLAYHFDEGGDGAQAVKYLALAGDRAARLYANQEAVRHYERALALALAPDGPGAPAEVLIHLFTSQGRALELDGQQAAALALYARMEALGQERGDQRLELAALMAQATVYGTANQQFNPAMATALSNRAQALAQAVQDGAAEAKILWNLMNILRFTDRTAAAAAAGEQSLAVARALDLREQVAYTLNDLFYVYLSENRLDEASAANLEARALWRALGNRAMLADNLSSSVIYSVFTGRLEEGLASAAEALAISREIGNAWGISFSQMGVALAHWMQGNFGEAMTALETTIHYGDQAGFLVGPLWARAQLAMVYGRLGQRERALELIEATQARVPKMSSRTPAMAILVGYLLQAYLAADAVESARALLESSDYATTGPGLLDELFDWAWAQLLLMTGRTAEAVRALPDMVERMCASKTLLLVPDVRLCLAQAYMAGGQLAEARAELEQAHSEALALELRWTAWQVLAALAALARAEDRTDDEAAALSEARALIDHIAAHAGSDELRQGFLGRTDVQAVLRAA